VSILLDLTQHNILILMSVDFSSCKYIAMDSCMSQLYIEC
jgi:hypothetical protein